jgi:acetylglutamate synthase
VIHELDVTAPRHRRTVVERSMEAEQPWLAWRHRHSALVVSWRLASSVAAASGGRSTNSDGFAVMWKGRSDLQA